MKKQAFVLIKEGFVPASDVFFNSKFNQINAYKDFQDAIFSLTGIQTPQEVVLKYLNEAPFEVKNYNLLNLALIITRN